MDFSNTKVGFIGAGNMARAIAVGLVEKGLVKLENMWASAPSMRNLCNFPDCNVTNINREVFDNCVIVLLCVKPYKFKEVTKEFSDYDFISCHTIISVISGIKLHNIEEAFGSGRARYVRVMPNLPAMVQSGVFAYSISNDSKDPKSCKSITEYLFSSLGICEEVPEDLLDTVCGLSGSGPGYVFTVIQAMSDGAVKMGLPRALATKMAAQTVMGAAQMVLETGKHPDVLRDEVCSPGGTTICGIHALEKASVHSAFMDAVEAATLKAREQGN